MIVAKRFVVSGRVQGVGYRFHARDAAAREGLGGFVRNRPDGRVEVEAEGDEESMRRFERALRQGPPAGRVSAVAVTETTPGAAAPGFRIAPWQPVVAPRGAPRAARRPPDNA